MSHISKSILVLAVAGLATTAQAADGEYYNGLGVDTYQRMTGFGQTITDPMSTGSVVKVAPSKTSRDNRFMGDEGDYYDGIGPH